MKIGPKCLNELLIALSLVCILFSSTAWSQEAEWQVGVSSIKITPEKPVVLAGYAARTKPFENVEQDIFSKGRALENSPGHSAILVTMDLCTTPRDVAGG